MSKQSTFGNTYVSEAKADARCDAEIIEQKTHEHRRCKNRAQIVVISDNNPITQYYCKVHAKETWLEMADLE